MPETVTTTIKARQLRAGDIVVGAFGRTATISEQPRVGRLYVTTRTSAQAGTVRWELEDDVEVERQQPTAEERAAKQLRNRLESLDWKERMDRERFAAVCAKVAEQAGRGQVPSWDLLEELPQAEATVQLWNRVARMHANRAQASIEGLAEEPTRLGTVADVAEIMIDDLLMGTRTGGSTSQASNLLEDGRRAGQASWCRAWREAQA